MSKYTHAEIDLREEVYKQMYELCYSGSKSVMFCKLCGHIGHWETLQQNFGSCCKCDIVFCRDCGVINDYKSGKNSYCMIDEPLTCEQTDCNKNDMLHVLACQNDSCSIVLACESCIEKNKVVTCNDCNQLVTIHYYNCGHILDPEEPHCSVCCYDEDNCDCVKGG